MPPQIPPQEPMSALHLIRLNPVTVVLIICSIASIATVIERAIKYRSIGIDAAGFMDRMRELLRAGSYAEALKLSDSTPGPVAAVVRAGILCRDRSKEELKDSMERVRIRQSAELEKYLPILGTIGATAPFIGLFGTVIGILEAFHNIAVAGTAGTTVVAEGIADALIATAGGLFVAIVAVVAYNFFINWGSGFNVEMETAANEMVHLLAPPSEPAPAPIPPGSPAASNPASAGGRSSRRQAAQAQEQ